MRCEPKLWVYGEKIVSGLKIREKKMIRISGSCEFLYHNSVAFEDAISLVRR
jgi:hypothetical protein